MVPGITAHGEGLHSAHDYHGMVPLPAYELITAAKQNLQYTAR
jgi:hypothetical protein